MVIPKLYFFPNKLFDKILELIKQSNDLEIVDNVELSDIICISQSDISVRLLAKYYPKCFIIWERFDSCSIGSTAKFLKYDQVLAVFKDYFFKINKIYRLAHKRHHYYLTNPIKYGYTEFNISDEEFNKVKIIPWGINQYSHSLSKKDMKYVFTNRNTIKDIDIFAIFHTHSNDKILDYHRKKVLAIVKQFESKYTIVVQQTRTKIEFMNFISRSKVVICPYGFGERIASDQFALLSDAVLIKPDCSHMITEPNIYTKDICTFFSPTCNDLKTTIDTVMNDLPTYQIKSRRGFKLLTNFNEMSIVNMCSANITNVMNSK
jgi:hypothetical protein